MLGRASQAGKSQVGKPAPAGAQLSPEACNGKGRWTHQAGQEVEA